MKCASEPIQVGGQSNILAGEFNSGSWFSYNAPAGKRLVIEFASVRAFYRNGISNTAETMDAALDLTVNANTILFNLGRFSEVAGTTGIPNQVLSKSLKLYADPGSTVSFLVYRSDRTEEVLLNQAISGYLEAVPKALPEFLF